jgi:arginase
VEPGRLGNRLKNTDVPIDVIQVPMALGADRHGVDRGAADLDRATRDRLESRGFDHVLQRFCSSREIGVDSLDSMPVSDHPSVRALHVDAIAAASHLLAGEVERSIKAGHLALVIGGDHALSIGSLAGASTVGRLGVIWIDAHADINTPETSPSGHVHGMPIAAAIGRGPKQLVEVGSRADLRLEDLVYIGLRDLDLGERNLLRESPALLYPISSVETLGIAAVTYEAIRRLFERKVDAVHISFDLDSLDPTIMPGTGTPVPGGLTYREARHLLSLLRASDLPIVSADVVELNPTLDPTGGSLEVAAGLTAALLGEELV